MYALLFFDITSAIKDSETAHAASFQINNFLDELSHSIALNEGDEKILESAFLFALENGLSNLRHMIASLEKWKIPYKVLPLNEKPTFIT